jgi:hypothetical protein
MNDVNGNFEEEDTVLDLEGQRLNPAMELVPCPPLCNTAMYWELRNWVRNTGGRKDRPFVRWCFDVGVLSRAQHQQPSTIFGKQGRHYIAVCRSKPRKAPSRCRRIAARMTLYMRPSRSTCRSRIATAPPRFTCPIPMQVSTT